MKIEEGPHGSMRPLGSRSIDPLSANTRDFDELMKSVYRSMLDDIEVNPVHEPTLSAMVGALKP